MSRLTALGTAMPPYNFVLFVASCKKKSRALAGAAGVALLRRQAQAGGMAERFVSEPLVPDPAAIEAAGMAAGVPGLPRRFTWNGRTHEVARVLKRWREAGPERGRSGPDAERYARRHWWHVVTTDGVELKFYCERQARTSRRWWVYSVKE